MKCAISAIALALLTTCGCLFAPPALSQEAYFRQFETLRNEGRFAEAIAALNRAILALQAQNQLATPKGAILFNNLGELHYQLGRYAEAIPYYERSISLAKGRLSEPQIAITYRNLGIVCQLTGRLADAVSAYKASIALLSKYPNERVQLASTINNVATLLQDQKRYADAEKLYQQALGIYRGAFGEKHLYTAAAYNNLGELYEAAGDLSRAEPMMLTANAILAEVFNRDHPRRVPTLRNLGLFYSKKQDWPKAVQYYREAVEILEKQGERSVRSRDAQLAATDLDPSVQKAAAGEYINASMKLLMADRSQGVALSREVFKAGQWRPSQTAASLLQMSARASAGGDALSSLLRRRQDLAAEWQSRQQALTQAALKNETSAAGRDAAARLEAIGSEIAGLDRSISAQFPEYADLTNPAPLDVTEVQSLLGEDEALVLFIETGNPTWVWVVTKTEKSLSIVNMSSAALANQVAIFRCGLDQANWQDPSDWPETEPADARRKQAQKAIFERCRTLGREPAADGVLPFDTALAHKLYKLFFGAAGKAIAGKHLLIAPSESLMQMPFAALVVDEPRPDAALSEAKWLGAAAPLSILPSVSSLRALRRVSRPSEAKKAFLGFGNPLLSGDPEAASLALAKQTCSGGPVQFADSGARAPRRTFRLRPGDAFRGGLANVNVLKAQMPLPETADELCSVAGSLKASPDDVFLGERATEKVFKELSRNGRLADYRVIHFATHGLVSGDLPGISQPGLLLTPPATPTEEDDGLLTASEVAQAKLDANWVVLSACNTASGGAEGAEALSGLARAFFYAGSRALLVTHWQIDSEAAVKLTTGAFSAMETDSNISQAEAMRIAMASLAKDGRFTHPSLWAAFELIGDGGRK